MKRRISGSRALAAAAAASLLAVAVGCAGGDTGTEGGGDGSTFIYGASSDPVTLDGAYVSDGESLRPIRQIFETLVVTKPGSTEIEPLLAKKYNAMEGGKSWKFELNEGVKFTDGTDLNAEAVCTNFERWFNFTDPVQQTAAYYFATVFGTFGDKKADSLYKSCEAESDTVAVVNLNRPSSAFISAMSLPSFSIASPKALEEYEADKVGGSPDQPQFEGSFGTKNPIGTGPFKLQSWARGDKLVLVRNDDYWGDKPALKKVVIRPISDGSARRQALESGEIDAYDNVAPGDIQPLKDQDYKVLERPSFNVAYLGFNQKHKPLDNPKIRQAIAHALNREALLKAKYDEGAEVAKEFMPESLVGYADDVQTYDYDPKKAKQLIKDSGVKDLTLEFWYPTNVSRPYMPDPAANFQAFKRDLEAVGFTVKAKSAPWDSGYVTSTQAGKAPLYLLGWTGDFGDADNFLGTFFQGDQPQWGLEAGTPLSDKLNAAEKETDEAKRATMYEEANRMAMEQLPGVPYAHTKPGVAVKPTVKGYVPSPVGGESFAPITIGE